MPKKPPPTLGEILKSRRGALRLRREDVASRATLSLRSIHNYEEGLRSPTVEILARLARALDCTLEDIFASL